ncbi:hypothetical protein DAPPUDRAFT_236942 [Daphnia pulex]|uniref:Uncharacterized protein n=1 Tax=Daphnia pulex TaxID=6669 RepID=E9G2C1_DAPPU|nr:hypothetical protein DAPPUDRAFT_236942 [Daphnia pulex]|eukprot:EFX86221.1 hypothetical protein DAPPUDRAFT_236942 [Daphnia pulex]
MIASLLPVKCRQAAVTAEVAQHNNPADRMAAAAHHDATPQDTWQELRQWRPLGTLLTSLGNSKMTTITGDVEISGTNKKTDLERLTEIAVPVHCRKGPQKMKLSKLFPNLVKEYSASPPFREEEKRRKAVVCGLTSREKKKTEPTPPEKKKEAAGGRRLVIRVYRSRNPRVPGLSVPI